MSLEAIAALLGHKSMSMTMTYARIADRVPSNAPLEPTFNEHEPALARRGRETGQGQWPKFLSAAP